VWVRESDELRPDREAGEDLKGAELWKSICGLLEALRGDLIK
jgi:hypothetical protein